MFFFSTLSIPAAAITGHHYKAGTLPDHVSREKLVSETRDFYQQWKSAYIRKTDSFAGCPAKDQYVVYVNSDGRFSDDTDALTVSEAHGFGMLIVAMMSEKEPADREIFDGMVRYFKDHQVAKAPNLMTWKQGVDCGNKDGESAATDGDEDIAYALLLADKKWGSSGAVNYRKEAKAVIDAIMLYEVSDSDLITAGNEFKANSEEFRRNAVRPSDFMPGHLKAFHKATGDDRWLKVLNRMYAMIDLFQKTNSPETGLISDVIEDATSTNPRPARADFFDDEDVDASTFNYNACRVPLRIGVDYLVTRDPRARVILDRLNKWFVSKELASPVLLYDGYKLDGNELTDTASLAFTGPFAVMSMERPASPTNQKWLNATWNILDTYPIENEGYYGNTLKMMSMIALSGRWAGA